jgi:nucleoside-diphosphate-sugar epimerase
MTPQPTILVLGGTGRTGRRVLAQLLARGASVRAIVRSAARLPAELTGHPRLQVSEADLLGLSDEELRRHLAGCQAVVSCLGHTVSFQGVYGGPRHLVEQAVLRIGRAAKVLRPSPPLRLVLISSVSVNAPASTDSRRAGFERAVLWAVRAALPPAGDNQRAADFLCQAIGTADPHLEWVIVRPDTLIEGEVTRYTIHPAPVSSLFKPDRSRMANVAHFMSELACEPGPWEEWKGRLPVIVDDQTDTAGTV